MSTEFLFVYGSLLRRTGVRAVDRIVQRHVRRLGPASVPGRLYDLGAYPGAVTADRPRHRVHGQVLELRQAQRWLPILDRYEGHVPNDIRRCEFVRQRVCAQLTHQRRKVSCWMYVYNGSVAHRRRLRSGRDRRR